MPAAAAPKKTAKPKVAPTPKKAPAGKDTPAKETVLKPDAHGHDRIDNVVGEMFVCYDQDYDDLIERVEFLDGEEHRVGRIDFGFKQRKEAFQWFKDAGATGNATDGMFLTKEQFKEAMVKTAKAEMDALKAADPAKCPFKEVAEYLWETRAKALIEAFYRASALSHGTSAENIVKLKMQFAGLDVNHDGYLEFAELSALLRKLDPSMAEEGVRLLFNEVDKAGHGKVAFTDFVDYVFATPKAPTAAVDKARADKPIVYPITIPFTDLKKCLQEARHAGRMALILASGLEQVETFLTYQQNQTIDCKELLGKIFVAKTMSMEEGQELAIKKLKYALDGNGFCQPLHVRLANSAFDWKKFCCKDFPPEVFSGTLWTIQHALELNLIHAPHAMSLGLENEKKWQDFHVILSSSYDLEKANEYLFDKIPFYDELAIIVVDPKSIAEA